MPQKPYMEQHPPFGQSPQMVPPLLAPHEPSVVTSPVALAEPEADEAVGDPRTGSWVEVVVVVGSAALLVPAAAEEEAEDAPLQPFWQPLETRQ